MAGIPIECRALQTRIDDLTEQRDSLQESLRHAGPTQKPAIIQEIRALNVTIAQTTNELAQCIIAHPEQLPAPPPTRPEITKDDPVVDCRPFQARLDDLKRQLRNLQEELKHASPPQKPEIVKEIRGMGPIIAEAERALARCLQTRPVLPIVTKVIRLDFLQRKFDEFFNNRQDRPLFKLLLDNTGDNSFIDASFIDPYAYTSIGRSDQGQLDYGYYFNDINSSKISLNFDTVQPAQLTFRIDFETGGGIEMPTSSTFFHDMDFKEFFIAIKATFVADSPLG